jgi:hypothetical protein
MLKLLRFVVPPAEGPAAYAGAASFCAHDVACIQTASSRAARALAKTLFFPDLVAG